MFVVRQGQLEALGEAVAQSFEDQTDDHLREFAPELVGIAGAEGVRQVVGLGIQRAERYGFICRGPVRFYIELLFVLGCDFDTDPQLPWARTTLTDESISDQFQRAERLHVQVNAYLDCVTGPRNEHALAAIRRIEKSWFRTPPAADESIDSRLLAELHAVYPEKSEYLGEAALRRLIQQGLAVATDQGIGSPVGIATIVGLMYAFGSGVVGDPLYRWIAHTIDTARVGGSQARELRLQEKARLYLGQLLKNLE